MKICVLSTRYPYRDIMLHVFVKKLVDEWARAGHRCVVISPVSKTKSILYGEKYPYYERQKIENGIVDIYRPCYIQIPNITICDVNLNKWFRQKSVERVIKSIGINFDFVYAHFFEMAVEGWHYIHKYNIPFFVATGESTVIIPRKPCKSFSIEKFKEDTTGVIAVSSKNKEEASEIGIIESSKTHVFPNGANLSIFKRIDKTECRKKIGLPQNAFIIVCVGQFIDRKGQKRILKALDQLNIKDIKTLFIGKGELQLEHPSILYKGTVNNDLMPTYLNAADLFVLPTLHEGCCNAIIEALACGLPIVSSDLPFNYDVLDDTNSIMVNPNDIDAIAAAIKTLYVDSNLRERLSDGSFAKGQQLSITQRANNILGFIEQQINER